MTEANYPESTKRVIIVKGEFIYLCDKLLVQSVEHWLALYIRASLTTYTILSSPLPHDPLPYPTAPKIFPTAYNLVKHFMDKYTRQKIIVLGSKSPYIAILHDALITEYNCPVSQATGRKKYRSTLLQTSCLRPTEAPGVSQTPGVQTM